MISKIDIQNFQSHKKTTLNLVPGTNVIVGVSDSGKSAIFRAINWVVNNRPLGDEFRSEWGGDTNVTLHLSEEDTVTRFRTASRNEYTINGTTLKAFGSEVPQEVLDILRLDSFNVQAQMDIPFLLSNTGGEAAKILNRAASLEDIDINIGGLKRSLTQIERSLGHDESSLTSLQEQILQYGHLTEIEKLVGEVDIVANELETVTKRFNNLQQIIGDITELQGQIQVTDHIPQLLQDVLSLTEWTVENGRDVSRAKKLQSIMDDIQHVTKELGKTKNVDDALEKLESTEISVRDLQQMTKEKTDLERLIGRIENTDRRLQGTNKEIQRMTEEFNEISPEECPLCGAPMRKG